MLEASGLVRSTREANVFWSHNDSGNEERIFAFDSTGRAVGSMRIPGHQNRDWEALALGPCDDGACLYVGDVGDNLAHHATVRVLRIGEPRVADTVATSMITMEFRYADGPHDVEAMWVTPDTSVFVLTKRPARDAAGRYRPARIYRIPASAWRTNSVTIVDVVDSLPIVPMPNSSRGWITDAALSAPDSAGARHLAVRTYGDVYLFGIDAVTWLPTTLIATCSLKALRERNSGEAATWLADGRLMFVAEGAAARLHTGRCP